MSSTSTGNILERATLWFDQKKHEIETSASYFKELGDMATRNLRVADRLAEALSPLVAIEHELRESAQALLDFLMPGSVTTAEPYVSPPRRRKARHPKACDHGKAPGEPCGDCNFYRHLKKVNDFEAAKGSGSIDWSKVTLTVHEIAKRLGVHNTSVYAWKRGTSRPTGKNARHLAKLLGAPIPTSDACRVCSGPHRARGFCSMHYTRAERLVAQGATWKQLQDDPALLDGPKAPGKKRMVSTAKPRSTEAFLLRRLAEAKEPQTAKELGGGKSALKALKHLTSEGKVEYRKIPRRDGKPGRPRETYALTASKSKTNHEEAVLEALRNAGSEGLVTKALNKTTNLLRTKAIHDLVSQGKIRHESYKPKSGCPGKRYFLVDDQQKGAAAS